MTGRSIGALKRIALLAVGAGIAASLVSAAPSYAVNCREDGRINGGGATLSQTAFRSVFVPAYTREVCRYLPPAESTLTDANNEPNSGSKMVWYNWVGRPSGSGGGINGAHCRVDAFSGSDVPFTIAQLTLLRGAVPTPADPLCVPFQGLNQQFSPGPAPFPAATDTQSGILAFPILGAAVSIGFNLTAAACGGSTPPTSITLDSLQASRLFGGDIVSWNDAALVAIQPTSALANCATPVTRFARAENSGTTTIFKSYLNKADGARALCDGTTWSGRTGQAGGNFPAGGTCSPVTYVNGNPGVVNGVAGTVGAVGYGDLADWRNLQPQLGLAQVRNQSNDAYVSPISGTASNCSFAGAQLPTGAQAGAVNVAGNAWASDASPNRSDVTYVSSGYPICGYSWIIVRQNLGSGGTSLSELTQNQRDTLSAFVLFILQPTTQAQLGGQFYASIPASFLAPIRNGFIQFYPVTATP